MNDADFESWSPGEAMLADRSHLSFDWMEIEDDGESFAAFRALPQADKEALFAACVARTVKPQLAFEPQARPELEATVARLDIEFAKHVRPTAAMLWSRINKSRILDIARTVIGISWASARAKTKKAPLAEAMETAFAAGDTPVGLSAAMHAAALAWTPPGFAAFDTGRMVDSAEDAPADVSKSEAEPASEPATDAVETAKTPVGPPRRTSVVESIESPAVAARRAEALTARANGNGDAPAPEPGTSDAGRGDTGGNDPDPAVAGGPDGIAATDPTPPVPANGHDAHPDPMEIPEFLRRVQ